MPTPSVRYHGGRSRWRAQPRHPPRRGVPPPTPPRVTMLPGVYVRDKESGRIVFHALGTPTRADVADVARPRKALPSLATGDKAKQWEANRGGKGRAEGREDRFLLRSKKSG